MQDLNGVAAAAEGFSGAEIESSVQTALYAAFAGEQKLSTEDLLTALSSTVTLSITRWYVDGFLHSSGRARMRLRKAYVWLSSKALVISEKISITQVKVGRKRFFSARP